MRKFDFWKTDWFLGVMVVIVVALFNRFSDLVPSLERRSIFNPWKNKCFVVSGKRTLASGTTVAFIVVYKSVHYGARQKPR